MALHINKDIVLKKDDEISFSNKENGFRCEIRAIIYMERGHFLLRIKPIYN